MAASSTSVKPTRISILTEKCQRCGLCVEICPEGLFRRRDAQSVPRLVGLKRCIVCGHCVSVCNGKAIRHADFPEDDWLY
jgi:ferredoxin